MDFLRNRTFRQTLLVHAGQRIDRQVQAQRLLKMFVASPLKPESPVEDVNNNETVKFCGKSAVTKTRDPLMKATLLQLSELYPTSVEVSQVIGTTLTNLRGEPAFVDPNVLTSDSNRVAEPLIRCFETGQVELSVIPTNFVTTVSQRPSLSAYTRFQAKTSNIVTSVRHTTVELSDLQRHVAQHLDGTRTVDQVKDVLVELAQHGKIAVHHEGTPVKDHSKIRELIDKPVDAALRQLAKFVLLTA
jgi:methyltransferase-like protein